MVTEQTTLDLLVQVAAKIKTGRELMGSKWGNCEAEVIACQTISACAMNLKNHGDAFSWQGTGTQSISGGGLCDNPKGMRSLTKDGSIVVEPYNNPKGLNVPRDTVRNSDGKPMVLRCSDSLIYYAASEILK